MKNSQISWTDHTFNPWIGCTKVSPGCAHCYAETLMDKRMGRATWGKGQPRSRTSADYWREPLKWDRDSAEALGRYHDGYVGGPPPRRPRVFCASLADWLDDEVPIEWLADLLDLIRRTPNLDWLLLTKRPQNWRSRMEAIHALRPAPSQDAWLVANEWLGGRPPANVWIGTSVENQPMADERIPLLLDIPARIRFLSMEPLLRAVDISQNYWLTGQARLEDKTLTPVGSYPRIHWVIVGGESGPKARPMHPQWARSIRDQCAAAGVAFHFKQHGEWISHLDYAPNTMPPIGETALRPIATYYFDGAKADGPEAYRVGKQAAGRLLDGVEHNGIPEASS